MKFSQMQGGEKTGGEYAQATMSILKFLEDAFRAQWTKASLYFPYQPDLGLFS